MTSALPRASSPRYHAAAGAGARQALATQARKLGYVACSPSQAQQQPTGSGAQPEEGVANSGERWAVAPHPFAHIRPHQTPRRMREAAWPEPAPMELDVPGQASEPAVSCEASAAAANTSQRCRCIRLVILPDGPPRLQQQPLGAWRNNNSKLLTRHPPCRRRAWYSLRPASM